MFCGRRETVHHKLLERSYVEGLLAAQRAADVECPVGDVMRAELAAGAEEACAGDAGADDEAGAPPLLACMCCYYWVERRRAAEGGVVKLCSPYRSFSGFLRFFNQELTRASLRNTLETPCFPSRLAANQRNRRHLTNAVTLIVSASREGVRQDGTVNTPPNTPC